MARLNAVGEDPRQVPVVNFHRLALRRFTSRAELAGSRPSCPAPRFHGFRFPITVEDQSLSIHLDHSSPLCIDIRDTCCDVLPSLPCLRVVILERCVPEMWRLVLPASGVRWPVDCHEQRFETRSSSHPLAIAFIANLVEWGGTRLRENMSVSKTCQQSRPGSCVLVRRWLVRPTPLEVSRSR